jgi:two-component system, NarL family, invasion response regulator UvrY
MQASDTLNIMNKLSPREKEVALCIAKGISTNDIAKKLGIKSNTVSTFRKKIFVKLSINSNVEIFKLFLNN